MPNGLVKNSWQPKVAVEFLKTLLVSMVPVTAKPKMGSGESMLCPPANEIPASRHAARPPSTTCWATFAGSLSIGQPNIAMAMMGLPPIAYISLIALVAAILPKV